MKRIILFATFFIFGFALMVQKDLYSNPKQDGKKIIPAGLMDSPVLTIPGFYYAVAGAVSIPVHAANFINLGAFQFTLEFNPALMTYTGCTNWYPGITDVMIGTTSPGKLTFIWAASTQGVNIPGGTFFNINFIWSGSSGTSPIAWKDSPTPREFSDYNGLILSPMYSDGSVSGILPESHFIPVWSGIATSPMAIGIKQATYNLADLSAGDEIGIFDGNICVGAYKLEAPVNPDNPPFITVSKDDPGMPGITGYTEGHTIVYKIWQQSTSLEAVTVMHSFPYAPLFMFETFTPNETAVVNLAGTSVPATRTLQNITVPGEQINCYNASQLITVAGSGTTFLVENSGSVTMIAGQNILYLPGTTVQSGGYMWGYIAPNGPYCANPSMPAVIAGKSELPVIVENSSFEVYPNPTNGKFILELKMENLLETINVTIYGIQGEKMHSIKLIGERKHEFSLADRPDGVYLIRLHVGSKTENKKMIKY